MVRHHDLASKFTAHVANPRRRWFLLGTELSAGVEFLMRYSFAAPSTTPEEGSRPAPTKAILSRKGGAQ
jgi:hypothetical protein